MRRQEEFRRPDLSAWQFEQLYGRKPQMSGTLDIRQAEVWERAGYELKESECVGDEIRSWIVIRGPSSGVVDEEPRMSWLRGDLF